jgi:hypothetical protein
MNDELERVWKERAVAYQGIILAFAWRGPPLWPIKVLSWPLHGGDRRCGLSRYYPGLCMEETASVD